ncbi:MAG: hypothetical protein E6G76_14405 [Alphaproteobacteria bacterium]|jgi:hypothetical protein|nr:MAG: hypothetical protein E6G76_14405 [Alphaproteobacteria bacterium]
MTRRPACLTQADIARAIRAAKQAGAAQVEVQVGDQRIIIRINPPTEDASPLEPSHEITL